MHTEIYDHLKSVAKKQDYTTYTDIAPMAGLDMGLDCDRAKIGEILGEISTAEHKQGRPLLSVVVIHRDNNIPGPGFFKLAKQLGQYKASNDLLFFVDQLRRVHDHWRTP